MPRLDNARPTTLPFHTVGYASTMEGFSISDGIEAWYMELIGKGRHGKGLVWVALRVPDGYFTANANQARITQFLPCDDPSQCRAAPDAISFAARHGYFNGSAADFSFSDVYDPLTPEGARFCEARVWDIFSQVGGINSSYYLPYAQGFDLSRRMPLWVKPAKQLGREDLASCLGWHKRNRQSSRLQHLGCACANGGKLWERRIVRRRRLLTCLDEHRRGLG